MNCTICDSDLITSVYGKEDMRWDCWGYDKHIYRCGLCGLKFLYPPWSNEEVARLYHDYFNKKDFPGQIQAQRLTPYLDSYIGTAMLILEIGCGLAENLNTLKRKYPNRYIIGIDKDVNVCDGLNIFNAGYEDFNPPIRFHFIYAIQVFEHIQNPVNFITKIQSLLVKGGGFLLEIPNSDDPLLSMYKVEEFEKFSNIPHHMFFYNEKTVKLLFEKVNIPIRIQLYQKYGILNHLRWLIFKRPGDFHPHIPIIDDIYKWILINIFKKSDTIIINGVKL